MRVPSPFLQSGPRVGDRLAMKSPRVVRVPQHADCRTGDAIHQRDHFVTATEIAMSLDQDVDPDRAGVLTQSLQAAGHPVELRSLVFIRSNHVAKDADETRSQLASEIAVRSARRELRVANRSLGLFKTHGRRQTADSEAGIGELSLSNRQLRRTKFRPLEQVGFPLDQPNLDAVVAVLDTASDDFVKAPIGTTQSRKCQQRLASAFIRSDMVAGLSANR